MKPTAALLGSSILVATGSRRSIMLKSALPATIAAFCILSPSAHAGNTWDGGGADNNSNTANNWNPNGTPTAGPLTFAGTTRTTVVWNGINSGAPMNLDTITFSAGAGAFQLNVGTQTAIQFIANSTSTILNSSTNLQTLGIESRVFFNGTKTFDAGASNAGLALNGGILFRGDSMLTGEINRLDLIGTGNGTTTTIGRAGTFAGTATTQLVKNGSGKWTITGNVTDTGTHTITQGTLEYQGSIASSGITNNSAMILNNGVDQSYANNIGGSGSLTKRGAGAFTLNGTNGYSGATNVAGGKLSIGSTGTINSTSSVTIGTASTAATTEFNYNSSTALAPAVSFATGSTGGTLSGSGTISQTVNITTGNTLAIGNSVGTMNFGNNLTIGGTYLFELNNTDNTADLGDVAGTLTLGGILDLVQLGAYADGDKFTLLAYDGTLSGLFKDSGGISDILDDTNFTDAGGTWNLNYNDTTAGLNGGVSASNTYVTITAIPEPGAALLGGLGLLALLRRRRN